MGRFFYIILAYELGQDGGRTLSSWRWVEVTFEVFEITLRLVFVTRTRLKQAGIHREVTEIHRGFFIYHKEHKEHKVSQRKLKGWGGFSI